MKKYALIALLSVVPMVQAEPKITPQFKPVQLKEFTTMELKVMPDAGTQLIFPFKLDNPELQPALKIRLTNSNGFEVPHTPEDIERYLVDQNTITILGKVNDQAPGAKYLGNLFINIGGYNISIGLRTTLNVNEHVSNIVFQISDKERDHLVENLVVRRTKELERSYQEKLKGIDNIAMEKSLSYVAAITGMGNKTTRFKEEGEIKLDDTRLEVFVDKVMNYENTFAVMVFELRNNSSQTLQFNNIDIVSIEGDIEKTISGSSKCVDDLTKGEKAVCRFATLDMEFPKAKKLRLKVNTNKGEGAFEW